MKAFPTVLAAGVLALSAFAAAASVVDLTAGGSAAGNTADTGTFASDAITGPIPAGCDLSGTDTRCDLSGELDAPGIRIDGNGIGGRRDDTVSVPGEAGPGILVGIEAQALDFLNDTSRSSLRSVTWSWVAAGVLALSASAAAAGVADLTAGGSATGNTAATGTFAPGAITGPIPAGCDFSGTSRNCSLSGDKVPPGLRIGDLDGENRGAYLQFTFDTMARLLSFQFSGLGSRDAPDLHINGTRAAKAAEDTPSTTPFSGLGTMTIIAREGEGAISPIPLPAAGWLLLAGLGALGAVARCKAAATGRAAGAGRSGRRGVIRAAAPRACVPRFRKNNKNLVPRALVFAPLPSLHAQVVTCAKPLLRRGFCGITMTSPRPIPACPPEPPAKRFAMTPAAPLSALAFAFGLAAAPVAAFAPAPPVALPGVLPVDHSDRTETHGCLCDDWFLGMLDSEDRPLALASVDPRHQASRRDFSADAGSLADTRHLVRTLQPRLLRVEYDFDRKPGDAVLLLAGTGAIQTETGICRVRVAIANSGDRELPDIAYLWDFDWSVPADEIAGQIHLAGLAPITGQELAAGPAGLPACTGPTDADLMRFFASGAPIPLPQRIGGGTGFQPLQVAQLTTPPTQRGLPPAPTPRVLSFTPISGGGGSGGGSSTIGGGTPTQTSSQHSFDPGPGPGTPTTPVVPTPLPASLWLLLGGLGLLLGGRRVFLGRTAAS